jgi:hypothetical protein
LPSRSSTYRPLILEEPFYFTPRAPRRKFASNFATAASNLSESVHAEAAREKILRDKSSRPLPNSLGRQKQCPAIGRLSENSLTAGSLLRKSHCEASTSRLVFSFKTRAGFVGFVKRTCHSLDWVRLALPRSPESGFAVSAYVNFLSREKRKMWMTFSYCVYT